jgi:hypothetical protein
MKPSGMMASQTKAKMNALLGGRCNVASQVHVLSE